MRLLNIFAAECINFKINNWQIKNDFSKTNSNEAHWKSYNYSQNLIDVFNKNIKFIFYLQDEQHCARCTELKKNCIAFIY